MLLMLTNFLREDVFSEKNRILDTYLKASHKVWVASEKMNKDPKSAELNRKHDEALTLFQRALEELNAHFSSAENKEAAIKQRKSELKAQRKNYILLKFLTVGNELKAAEAEFLKDPYNQVKKEECIRVNALFQSLRQKMFKKFKNEVLSGHIVGILIDKKIELQEKEKTFTLMQD